MRNFSLYGGDRSPPISYMSCNSLSTSNCLLSKIEKMVLDTIGGGSRIRTGDILLAKQTLYQLSYTPKGFMVGLTRIELVTSSLSGTRSNQLSYKPNVSL